MAAQYTVGETLPNGATVVSDVYTLNEDGSSLESMVDSANNGLNISLPAPGEVAKAQARAAALDNLNSVVSLLTPGLAQAQADLATLATSTDPLAPILARVVQDLAVAAQAIGDILSVEQIVS